MRRIAHLLLLFSIVSSPAIGNNLVINGDFTTNLDGWTIEAGTWELEPISRSVGVTADGAGPQSLSQCIDISEFGSGSTLTLGGFYTPWTHSNPGTIAVEIYTSADCGGSAAAEAYETVSPAAQTTAGPYAPVVLPAGAHSALVRITAEASEAGELSFFDFISLRFDLIVEGNFQEDFDFWVQTPPGSWELIDDGVSQPSGAALATVAEDGSVFLSQCLHLEGTPDTPLYFGVLRVKALDELADYQLSFQWSSELGCTGDLGAFGFLTRPTQVGEWQTFFTPVEKAAGAISIGVFIALNPGAGTPGSQWVVDDFAMTVSDLQFADGFESGDTSQWSTTSP